MSETVQDTNDQATPQDGEQTFSADYVQKLRQEAAAYRTQLRDVQAQLGEVQPLAEQYKQAQQAQKTEAERMAEQLATFQAQLDAAQKEADTARKQARLTTLATQAGVSADVLPFLSITAFDLDDEEATVSALRKLAAPRASGGPVSNPANGAKAETPQERRARLFGGAQPLYIFGDK